MIFGLEFLLWMELDYSRSNALRWNVPRRLCLLNQAAEPQMKMPRQSLGTRRTPDSRSRHDFSNPAAKETFFQLHLPGSLQASGHC